MPQLQTKWIGDDQVTQAKIAAGAVDTTELAADAVDGTRIADDAVDTEHLADDAVEAAAISTGAVTSDGLNASAITGQTLITTIEGSDQVLVSDNSDSGNLKRISVTNFGGGGGGATLHQESHVITAGEVTQGYFSLSNAPANTTHVTAFAAGGIPLVNKQITPTVAADFDILGTGSDEFHFNNNGIATELSALLVESDEIIVQYGY